MKISKTLFKNLTRCDNFAGYYDMFINKNAHHIKFIEGVETSKNKNIDELQEAMNDLSKMYSKVILDDNFLDQLENEKEIFGEMFDEETGENALEVTNEQMMALSPYFSKVELVAANELKRISSGKYIYGESINEQKKFSFKDEENEYYSYLDIYNETDDDTINIVEVKSTTSSKFLELGTKIKGFVKSETKRDHKKDEYDSIFVKCGSILKLKEEIDPSILKDKIYIEKREKLFERFSDYGKYVYDIAVERYIVENSLKQSNQSYLIDKIKFYLAVLNCEYILPYTLEEGSLDYPIDNNGESIITFIDLTKITKEYMDIIDNQRKHLIEVNNSKSIGNLCIGKCCQYKSPQECMFKKVCFRKVLHNYSVLEFLSNINFKDKMGKFDLIKNNIYDIKDTDDDLLLSEKHIIQKDCVVNDKVFYREDVMNEFFKDIKYPIYHLDFETFGCPLPRFVGESPYMQSLFQYSLHVEKGYHQCDKELNHFEYLAKDHKDHRLDLAKSMIKNIDLSSEGTVLVYNEGFEKTRLKELGYIFPEIFDEVHNIRNHVFDLMKVLKGNEKLYVAHFPNYKDEGFKDSDAKLFNYYHKDLHGSFSIKKVLPLFTNLSYKDLVVGNGSQAVLTYSLLPTLSDSEYKRLYLALEKYCQQDTWSMVEILWGLKEKICKNK